MSRLFDVLYPSGISPTKTPNVNIIPGDVSPWQIFLAVLLRPHDLDPGTPDSTNNDMAGAGARYSGAADKRRSGNEP